MVPEQSTKERTLQRHWNLVSFPIETITPIADLMQAGGQYANIQSVWQWDAKKQTWKVYPEDSDFDLLTEVTPDGGYWVRARSSFDFTGTGVSENNYTFEVGWNLVGYSHSATTKTLVDFFVDGDFWQGSCGTTDAVINVWAWHGNTWTVFFPDDADRVQFNVDQGTSFEALTAVEPGMGLWINVQQNNHPQPPGGCEVVTTTTSSTTTTIGNETTTTTLPSSDRRMIFVTDTRVTGDIKNNATIPGSTVKDKVDWICENDPANPDQTWNYRALLYIAGERELENSLSPVFHQGETYYRTDGTTVISTVQSIIPPYILKTPLDNSISGEFSWRYWNGMNSSGFPSQNYLCENWSTSSGDSISFAGSPIAVNEEWMSTGFNYCSEDGSLLCVAYDKK